MFFFYITTFWKSSTGNAATKKTSNSCKNQISTGGVFFSRRAFSPTFINLNPSSGTKRRSFSPRDLKLCVERALMHTKLFCFQRFSRKPLLHTHQGTRKYAQKSVFSLFLYFPPHFCLRNRHLSVLSVLESKLT